jgi:hypothetical protein
MSEQSPEKAKVNELSEEPEVEGHKAALTADRAAFAEAEEQEGPEVEGHLKAAFKPEDPLKKA